MLNVLLVSPCLPMDHTRYSGENAYTDLLLQNPPNGVVYHHYEDLIADGRASRIRLMYYLNTALRDSGILPPDLWVEFLKCDFAPQVLHIHGFSSVVRFPAKATSVPCIISTSTGSTYDLRHYLGWEDRRAIRARWRKRQYLRLIKARDSSLNPGNSSHVLVWSQFARQLHLDEGWVRPDQIDVLYPGLPWRGELHQGFDRKPGVTFLFIGRDFVRKNGQAVLDAFRRVHASHPGAQLIFVSTLPDGHKITYPGVQHYESLPRQELLERIYPQADVLLLPSRAEGFGLVLLEAMSFGMPVIGVNAWAMSEIIENGSNGFLLNPHGDLVAEISDAMLRCAVTERLNHLRHSTKQIFEARFAIKVHNARLLQFYETALTVSVPQRQHRGAKQHKGTQ